MTGGKGSAGSVEIIGAVDRSLSLLGPDVATFLLSWCIESSLPFPSLSLLVWRSVVFLDNLSAGDCGWLDCGVLGPFSGGGGEGGRPFLEVWLDLGLG